MSYAGCTGACAETCLLYGILRLCVHGWVQACRELMREIDEGIATAAELRKKGARTQDTRQ